MNLFLTICILMSISISGIVFCIQAYPERAYIMYMNPKYVVNSSVEVRRYNRRSIYYINYRGFFKHTWNNNVSIHIETYEYLHNEYRRSFVELHMPICDMLKSDIFFGAAFRSTGITCPVHAGLVVLANLSLNIENFPYEFPISKCLLNISFEAVKWQEITTFGHVYLTFKKTGKRKS